MLKLVQAGNRIEKVIDSLALKILEVISETVEHVCDSHIYLAKLEKCSGVK